MVTREPLTVDEDTRSSPLVRSATVWRVDEAPEVRKSVDELSPGEGILWIDLVGEPEAVPELLEELSPLCAGLTAEMLADLLTPDEEPTGSSYDDGRIRLASTFSVEPRRLRPKQERGSAQGAGVLVFQPVELLAAKDWILTCWHPIRTFAGAKKEAERPPGSSAEVHAAVAKTWQGQACSCAGDLGVLVMLELGTGYQAAHWALAAWHEDWELSLYVEDELDNPEELPNLWGSMAVLRDWLNPLNRPGLRSDPEKAWLPVTNHDNVVALDDRVDKALAKLRELSNVMRLSFNVLNVKLAEQERERKEGTRHRIELMAALFLVPTLVVGFYGANTWVPGQGAHWGFFVMTAVLVLFSGGAVGILMRWRRAEQLEAELVEGERQRVRAELLSSLHEP